MNTLSSTLIDTHIEERTHMGNRINQVMLMTSPVSAEILFI